MTAEPRPTRYVLELSCADLGEYDAVFMASLAAAAAELLGATGVHDFRNRSRIASDRGSFMKRAVVLVALVLAAGCKDETLEDLPNDRQEVRQDPMTVWQAPDQFPNVAWRCNGRTGVYLTTREHSAIVVVPNDPACGEG